MATLSLASLLTGYLLTTGLIELAGVGTRLSYAVAIITCSVLNFFGLRYYVFSKSTPSLVGAALKFFPSVLLFRNVEILIFSYLLQIYDNYHVVYFATAAASAGAKFLLYKFLIFRK